MKKSALAPLIVFVLAGFSSTDNFPAQEYRTLTVADWPLKFVQHDFDAFCYSTYRCAVRYNGFTFADDPDDKLQISSASLGSGYPDNLKASYLGVPNFPMPADVSWRSADGTAHHAEVDIAHIFAGGLIKHNAKREDIAEGVSIANPEIILEVNDRTINVYMRAHIPMKTLQIPGNRYSDYRADLVLAWSKTY